MSLIYYNIQDVDAENKIEFMRCWANFLNVKNLNAEILAKVVLETKTFSLRYY